MSDTAPPGPARPNFSLTGHTVLVTGAGRGLGQAMATAAAAAGAVVVGVARSRAELGQTADVVARAGGRLLAIPWDVADIERLPALVEAARAAAGDIHGVVHAAGVQLRKPSADITVAEWRQLMSVNLEAPFFLSLAVAAQHAAGAGASHVFVGSLTSSIGIARVVPYAASKSGVLGIVRGLAVEWAEEGIRVNAVAPGYFKTALTAQVFADPERAAWVESRIPMRRIGVPSDLDGAIVFLLSDASAYITGQLLNVDGGWLAG